MEKTENDQNFRSRHEQGRRRETDLKIPQKVKSALTVVTFGIKVPAGLFIPSMVTGAITGELKKVLIGFV